MEEIYTIKNIRKTVGMDTQTFSTLVGLSEDRIRFLEESGGAPTEEELKKIMTALSMHYRTPARLPTIEDVRDNLLGQIAETLNLNIDKLSHPFLPQFDAYIEPLYREARNAIFLGLNNAALAMLYVLLEYVVKDIRHTAKEKQKGSPLSVEEEKEMERWTFGQACSVAHQEGIIDDAEKENLNCIGEWMRNPLIHSKLLKSTEGDKWGNVQSASLETGKTKMVELNGRDHKFIRKIMMLERNKNNAWPFFLWVENFISNKYADTIELAKEGKLGAMFMVKNSESQPGDSGKVKPAPAAPPGVAKG